MFVTAALAAEDAKSAASGVFPPFDTTHYASQLFWLAITFGFFYYFLSRTVLPRIAETIETRRDRIAQDLDQAAAMKADADATVAAYEQSLAEAKANAGAIASEARDKAKAEAEAERKKSEEALATRLAEAEATITSMKTKALGEIDGIATDAATEILASLFGTKTTKADVAAAIKSVQGK